MARTLRGAPSAVEMSLVSVEPGSGYVKALVGGRDFYAPGGQVNLGLGGGYRTGFSSASGRLVSFFPADGQFPADIITQFLPVMEAGLGDLVDDRHRVLDGLTILSAHGHTYGHCMAHLQSASTEVYFSGDVFHHPLQLVRLSTKHMPA